MLYKNQIIFRSDHDLSIKIFVAHKITIFSRTKWYPQLISSWGHTGHWYTVIPTFSWSSRSLAVSYIFFGMWRWHVSNSRICLESALSCQNGLFFHVLAHCAIYTITSSFWVDWTLEIVWFFYELHMYKYFNGKVTIWTWK